jgi:hypothetical protein
VGIEDRLRKLERRLQPKPTPPTLIGAHTRRAIDGFVAALLAHAREIEDEAAARRTEHGEDGKGALSMAKISVLEKHPDGRAALDAVCAAYQPLRQRREELRKERG